MVKFSFIVILFMGVSTSLISAQEDDVLDVSLSWKKDHVYVDRIETTENDLYRKISHHGPAIENLWVAYRLYFNHLGSIDILSKFQPRLELKESKWYPGKDLKSKGYGTDNYLVRETIGLGGLRLFDGQSAQNIGPVSKRICEVSNDGKAASINMISKGIPYKGELIDIRMTITTKANERHAMITVDVLSGQKVEFITGLTNHPSLKRIGDNVIITWGDYKSAGTPAEFDVGAALIINAEEFQPYKNTDDEMLMISKPSTSLQYIISSSNSRENSTLNNYEAFKEYVEHLVALLN